MGEREESDGKWSNGGGESWSAPAQKAGRPKGQRPKHNFCSSRARLPSEAPLLEKALQFRESETVVYTTALTCIPWVIMASTGVIQLYTTHQKFPQKSLEPEAKRPICV